MATYAGAMIGSLPSLRELQAFDAAARRGSFAEAGRELRLSASAVSHRVKVLERQLGQPLFERGAQSLRLTDHGHAYLPVVQQALDDLQRGTEGIFGLDPPPTEVTVRAPVTYVSQVLAPALPELRRELAIDVLAVSSIWRPDGVHVEADLTIELEVDVHERLGPPVAALLVSNPTSPDETPLHRVDVLGYEDLWAAEALVGVPLRVASRAGAQVDTWAGALELVAGNPGWCSLVPDVLARAAVGGGRVADRGVAVPMRQRFGLVRRSPPRTEAPRVEEVATFLARLHER
jgi:DNA-binding transcriptional LysR family regulator